MIYRCIDMRVTQKVLPDELSKFSSFPWPWRSNISCHLEYLCLFRDIMGGSIRSVY